MLARGWSLVPLLALSSPGDALADDATRTATVVSVTASRLPRRLHEVPASVTVLSRAEIERHPSLTTDALVRAVPSVQTFRRSSSLAADPTAQGLNIRGLAPSGVSRALVLVDGVPANDPFGGSVYWRALPRLGLDRVEVVPGGGSALYGSAALGGVLELHSRPIERDGLEVDAWAGSQALVGGAARATVAGEVARIALESELVRMDGHAVVAEGQRGPIDREAASSHGVARARLELDPGGDARLSAALAYFDHAQNGGTRFTTAQVRQLRLSTQAELGERLALTLFAGWTTFDQTRARIAEGRVSEVLAAEQHVPSDDQGASVVYRAPELSALGVHRLSAGVDARRVAGESRERVGAATRRSGGEQRFYGLFAEDAWTPHRAVEVSLALRGDAVEDRDGSSGGATFPTRTLLEPSLRAGVRVELIEALALRASFHRSFRAPTLAELYRPFQVGTIRTAANPMLEPEVAWGGEAGVELRLGALWLLRATGFWTALHRPIVNATLSAPLLDGAQRQRQNLGEARVRGVETALEGRPWRGWSVLLAYDLIDALVTQHPTLVGKRLPQDPAHRATAAVAFRDPELLFATLELRVLGAQYEDDLNTLPLDPVALLSASLARPVTESLELYATVENVLDQTYVVGRAGVDTIGAPLAARVGLRYRTPRE